MQNRQVDPDGTTVDVAFGEILEGASASSSANYAGSGGQAALGATVLWPGDMVQVTFDGPVVPATDTLSVQNVFDLTGNQMAAVPTQAVGTADLLAPTMSGASATTVSGYANDRIVVAFSEPVLPLDAENLANDSLQSPTGTPLALAGSTIVYDAAADAATITLAASGGGAVNLSTGSTFAVGCAGIRDVAGNPIAGGASLSGAVGGDALAPAVASVTRNTSVDPLGRTLDVLFDEPVALATSEAASFTASGGQAFLASSTIEGATVVRLFFDDVLVPGATTISISGMEDPAGNTAAPSAPTVASPDVTVPTISASSATTLAGPGNDGLALTFGELVIPSDAVTPAAWSLESPTGTPVSLAGASFAYDAATRTTSITLPAGTNLQTGASYTLFVGGVRDVAGNSIGASASSAGSVGGDAAAPAVTVADRNEVADPGSRTVDLTFGEGVGAGAETASNYVLSGLSAPGVTSATVLFNGQTVRLHLDAAVDPAAHTLDVSGVSDLAGNAMAAATGIAITP